MKSRDLPRVPKAALQFVEQKKKDWLQSLPPGLKQYANDTIIQKKVRKQFLRSGVPYPAKPAMPSWTYFLPFPGHNLEQKPKRKALKIARAMAAMPDLICEYRD
ncbi:hypothetical protein RFI_32937 [Reticulomyxa filosa]|uniref:Uncharacterized protein n=1 Tax=Reticulomyxa filosa TaxID=46433 RepID=X6LUR8_RETFI|nr:hypothetical protein RFI_32937 [Reticulomyxa filosa]|eukprot:ETO04460.1 hypothetical protein RFI_32937 [Reticulomyxa filosa]